MSKRTCIICQTELTGRQQNACSTVCASKIYTNKRRDSGKLKGPKPLKYPFICIMCDRPGNATKTGVQRHPYCARVSTLTPERKLSSSTELVHVPKTQTKLAISVAKGSFWWAGACKACGEHFISPHGYSCCSETCRNTYKRANRNYSKRKRNFIISRDQNTCQLCYTKVDITLNPTDDFAPEIDHISPVHLGGDNSRDNLRLTHRVCNRSRNITGDYTDEYSFNLSSHSC